MTSDAVADDENLDGRRQGALPHRASGPAPDRVAGGS